MLVLIAGLVIFLANHSVRIFAEDWRQGLIARIGEGPWKGLYSLVSIVGLVLIVWGYGLSRLDPVVLWSPPIWTKHLAIVAEPGRPSSCSPPSSCRRVGSRRGSATP